MRIKFIDNSFYDRKILCRYLNEKKEGNSVYYTVSNLAGNSFQKITRAKGKNNGVQQQRLITNN